MAKGFTRDPEIEHACKAFAALPVGASVFVKGAVRADVEYLREPLRSMGVGIGITQTQNDPIHKCAGMRLKRKAGEYDEL